MRHELKEVFVEEVRPYANNPRKNDAAVEAVKKSIEQCGYVAPIVVDENMEILAGHTRFKAIKKLGWKTVQVLIRSGLNEEQKRKYRLLDNKTNELADWDLDLLKDELDELDFGDLDLDWGLPEETTEEAVEVEVPDLPEEPKSKIGDLYQLGRHRLLVGDSTVVTDVERLVGGVAIDLLITDPPYGVSYQANGSASEARARHRRTKMMSIVNDDLEGEEFVEFLKNAFMSADIVMKPGACFYIWYADAKAWYFREALNRVGMEVRQVIIWEKNALVLGRQDYQWIHEPCLYGWKDGAGHLWASDRKQSTVLHFDKPQSNDIHPTMKPIALFDYQIKNNTKGGDAVLDLFAGSGTTIMACEQNGRNAYCMEYDPRYADAIIERWETFTGEKAVLLNADDTYNN